MTSTKDFYKILIVGASGKGKTYSFRNMNRETTALINIEDKPLPFFEDFKFHKRPDIITKIKQVIEEANTNDNIDCIVIDSLSAYMDILIFEARKRYSGWDIWSYYNKELASFFNYIKKIKKEVFITGHYEWLQTEEGAKERRFKSKGKEWEGWVEKEFTIVLYCNSKFIDKQFEYTFLTASEDASAKCPPHIFDGVFEIENDSNFVLEKIRHKLK